MEKKRSVWPYAFTPALWALGDKSQALAWLDQAYRLRDGILLFLRVNPRLTSLHSDSRFEELLRRVRLAG